MDGLVSNRRERWLCQCSPKALSEKSSSNKSSNNIIMAREAGPDVVARLCRDLRPL
jgi:hypothetical protein